MDILILDEILEYCDKSDCIAREQYYINTFSPFYNICSKAGSSLGRLTTNATRLKLRKAWWLRLYNKGQKRLSLGEFIVNALSNKVKTLELKISRLQKELDSIIKKPEFKQSILTRAKKLEASSTAQAVYVLDINSGLTIVYPSARNAALALNASNSTIMNKLNGKNSTPYKGRYIISKGKASWPSPTPLHSLSPACRTEVERGNK
uniref:GIY-YIG endonuclease n=1 Tax=Juglanconis oblonga TaxID=1940568 RepID=A0A291LIQ6_9PEZI|nr:GIY-YIG endonuclease [Juglanconis oblonga]ATI20414.1 GIY-YIG endonuclease [Juglanconis oblonga]